MLKIISCQKCRIVKYFQYFFKSYSMLFNIGKIFILVPLKTIIFTYNCFSHKINIYWRGYIVKYIYSLKENMAFSFFSIFNPAQCYTYFYEQKNKKLNFST